MIQRGGNRITGGLLPMLLTRRLFPKSRGILNREQRGFCSSKLFFISSVFILKANNFYDETAQEELWAGILGADVLVR